MNKISQSHCTGTFPGINRVIDRIGDQLLSHLGGRLPAHDLAGINISDERRLGPAGTGAAIREIGDPQPVWCAGDETPPEPIRSPSRCRVSDGGTHPAPLACTTPTHFPHDPLHHAPRNIESIGAQHNPCLPGTENLEQCRRSPQPPDSVNNLRISPIGFRRATTGPMRVIRRRGDRDAVLIQRRAHRLDTPLETISAHPVSLVGADELHDY